jgi:putative transcriptional regulator
MTKAAKRKYRSEIAEVVHAGMRGLHRLGVVDKQTMREFDIRCLTPVDNLTPSDIVAMREKAGVSQAVFACALNVTPDYISKIERGTKRPTGATLKLLSLVRRKGFDAIL